MTSIAQSEREKGVLALVIALVLVLIGLPFYLDHRRGSQQANFQRCEAKYNLAKNERDALVSRYNEQKEVALSTYDQVRTPQAQQAYMRAQSQYAAVLSVNPIPKYTCGGSLPRAPASPSQPPPIPAATPTPTPTTTTKVMRTTQTVTGPGGISTVVLPGPRSTVTIRPRPTVRTVTRTVSPPSCLIRPVPPCVLQLTLPPLDH